MIDMSVYSMTGYASAQRSAATTSPAAESTASSAARLGLEIRSVNSRYLDLTFKLSEELRSFEPALRELLVRRLKRGKVEVRAALESNAANLVAEPSARLLQRLNTIQDNVKTWLPLATPLSVADVIRLTVGSTGGEHDWQADLLVLAEQVLAPGGDDMVLAGQTRLMGLQELADLDDADKLEFLADLGLDEPGLSKLIRTGYDLLGLQTYFTAGVKEVRAWTIHKGDTAPQAAGVIHTDFEKGFIRAQTISYEDFIACGGEAGAKEKGKMRVEGKEYVVQDGDVMNFLFNV